MEFLGQRGYITVIVIVFASLLSRDIAMIFRGIATIQNILELNSEYPFLQILAILTIRKLKNDILVRAGR